jgi:hypothetical protein
VADASHQRIQERAYQIWLREGRPHGRDLDHWSQAEQELSKEYHSAGAASQSQPPAQPPPRPTEAVHGADSQPRPQAHREQPAASGSSRTDGAAPPSHVDSPSGAAAAAGAAKKRTRGKLKEDPEAKTEGKPSKKQAGERAVREPPRK